MNKEIILLDSGPLSLITHANSKKEVVIKCQQWFKIIIKKYFVYIPEIADYEVRRELIHQKLKKGIERLNEIQNV